MNEELQRVLRMVEEGKLSTEQATEFIKAINMGADTSRNDLSFEKKSNDQKMLRVHVVSEDKDDVKVTIPLKLISSLKGIIPTIPQVKEHAGEIDFDMLFEAIENGIEGPIVDIKTEKETVLISID